MHINICHGAHATTGLVLAGGKSAAPGKVFLRYQKPTQPARNGSSETLRECVRLEGFLASDKLTHACRFDLLKQDCQLRGI